MTPFILIFIAVVALMIIFGIVGHQQAKKRREMLAAWAHASGLVFDGDKDRNFDHRFPLPPFRKGEGRYAYNRSSGERDGYRVIAGDFHYYTESTDSDGDTSRTHHHFSFFLFQPDFPLRKISIRKEHVFDKVGAAFGFDDIDFESAEFSKAFHVKCDDRKWAYDVIHPRTMEHLLRHREMRIDALPNALLVTAKKKWEIAQFEHYANAAIEFLDAVPQHAKEVAG